MSENDRFLEAAARIGRRLCRDALWDGRRCNWLGWTLEPAGHIFTPTYRAQSHTLYDGTAGIALFLGYLARFADEPIVRATLHGALNHAREALKKDRPAARYGFHAGTAGTASAFLHVGAALDDGSLLDLGAQLVGAVSHIEPDPAHVDVLTGCAGMIPLLLRAAELWGRADLLDAARRNGDHLLRTATRSDAGWSWNTMGVAGGAHLIGYAHGASGIACALLELHRVTHDEQFRTAALEALRYERGHFSAQSQSWPDLRVPSVPGQPEAPHPLVWCHGAAGVGFARLRAHAFLPDDKQVAAELDTAIGTVHRALTQPLVPGQGYSLCHGAAGQADLLLEAAAELARPALRQLANEVGVQGIVQFHDRDMPWPCGIPRGESPNLMIGLAGIGYFYLRLHAPDSVPSMLVLTPRTLIPEQRDETSAVQAAL